MYINWGWRRGGEYKALISSLSIGGCFIRTDIGALRGQTLFVQMWLSPTLFTEVEGQVAYNLEKIGLGVEFIALAEEAAAGIQEIIDFHLARTSQAKGKVG